MRYAAKKDKTTGIWTIHKSNTVSNEKTLHTLCGRNLVEYDEMSAAEYRLYVEMGYQSCEKCDRVDYK